MNSAPRLITLLSRAGCHLCDEARLTVMDVLAELGTVSVPVSFVERDVDSDEALRREYSDHVPVILIDGKVHNFWRIDSERLRRALTT